MTSIIRIVDMLFERSSRELVDKISCFDKGDFYLYGSGNMGRSVLSLIRSVGCEPRAFIDDTPEKQGTVIDGLSVISAPPSSPSTIIVCIHNPNHNYQKTLERFSGRSVLSFLHIPWLFPGVSIAHAAHPDEYKKYKNDIVSVYQALADEVSKRTFLEQLTFRLTLEWDFKEFTPSAYFPDDINLPFSEPVSFIDAGAYDGDTVKLFLRYFHNPGKVVAIEADPGNYVKLKRYMDTLKIDQVSYNAAIDGVAGVLKFDATGDMAARLSGTGSVSVNSYTLEHFMRDVSDPCYVKFDVEGAESSIIKQSQDLLFKRKPILAVSIYHQAQDMIEIPLLLHRLGYRITMRYHGIDGADLVLYATP